MNYVIYLWSRISNHSLNRLGLAAAFNLYVIYNAILFTYHLFIGLHDHLHSFLIVGFIIFILAFFSLASYTFSQSSIDKIIEYYDNFQISRKQYLKHFSLLFLLPFFIMVITVMNFGKAPLFGQSKYTYCDNEEIIPGERVGIYYLGKSKNEILNTYKDCNGSNVKIIINKESIKAKDIEFYFEDSLLVEIFVFKGYPAILNSEVKVGDTFKKLKKSCGDYKVVDNDFGFSSIIVEGYDGIYFSSDTCCKKPKLNEKIKYMEITRLGAPF